MTPSYSTAAQFVSLGSYYYKAIYHRWPASWSEVRSSLIFQTGLTSAEGKAIDPDDGKLDFVGDVQFLPAEGEAAPRLAIQMLVNSSSYVNYKRMGSNIDYARIYDMVRPESRDQMPEPTEARLKQMAIASIAQKGAEFSSEHTGGCPATWDEFIHSGVSPIDANSINPLTGEPFHGDGRANDLYFQSDGRGMVVKPVKADGSTRYPISLP